jgi:DNA polymerase IV
MTPRKILHLDLDAFFCAVEEQHNPELRGRAFAVGGRPEERGVVASCSYAARKFGVRSAMPMATALRLCPDLLIVAHRRGDYGAVSRQVMAKLNDLTPLVEQISIDEAFLDVTMLPDSAEVIARHLQATILDELGLPNSIGVASNKLVAKIANNIGKSTARKHGIDGPPNAITLVPPGQEAAFLAPLPVGELWGVGPKTAEKLESLGIKTIGDVAKLSDADLIRRFGKWGADLARHARGIDDRDIETERETKSISHETTFAKDVNDEQILRRTLRGLSDGVGRRLRKHELAGATVQIKLRWADFTTLTRQLTLTHATDLDNEIFAAAEKLFEANWRGQRVRLIGVGVSGFDGEGHQLGLWESREDAQEGRRLQEVIDALRDKFGDDAIHRASALVDDDLIED